MKKGPKKRRWPKVVMILLGLMVVSWVFLYYFIQSPRFLRFAINQLNKSLSGDFHYDTLALDLDHKSLTIRNLVYQNAQGQKVISLNALDMNFSFGSALQGNLGIEHLRAEGLLIDQRNAEKKIHPSSWRTALRIILKRLSVRDCIVQNITLYLRNGDEFHFDQTEVRLTSQPGAWQEVNVQVSHAKLKPAGKEIETGRLSFQGKSKLPVLKDFTFFVSEAEGKLDLENVKVGDLPPSTFQSNIKIGGDTLYLEEGRFIHPDGTLSVDIDYIPSKSTYKVDLKTMAPFPFSAIPHAGKELLETFDKFEFNLRADLQGYKLDQMNGKVALDFKALGDTANKLTPENKLHLVGDMKQGVLDLKEFKLQSAKSEVHASGKVDFPKQNLDVKVNTVGFDLASLIQALSDLDLRGYGDAEGSIKGPFKSPNFDFKAHGKELAYSFLHFGENVGVFKILDGNLSYEGAAPAGSGYTASVQVRTDNLFKKDRHTVMKTQFQGIDASKLLDNPDIKGKVSGIFDLDAISGTPPNGVLKAQIEDFLLYSFNLGPISAEGKLGNQHFTIAPLTFQPPNFEKMTLPGETVFEFDAKGVKVKGEALPGLGFTGHYEFQGPKKFFIDATAQKTDLRPIWAALQLPVIESYADGKVKMGLGIDKNPTEIDISLSRFLLPLEAGVIESAEPVEISIRPPRLEFKRMRLKSGGETIAVTGGWSLDGGLNLDVTGKLDLELLKLIPQAFREGSGFADLKLKLRGTEKDPQVSGDITFKDSTVSLRALRGDIEDINGRVSLNNNGLTFEKLKGTLAEGDITVDGRIDLKDLKPSYYDLKIEALEAAISEPGTYTLVFSGNFGLKGPADHSTLSGKMFLTEGRYIRNFNIAQFILTPAPKELPSEPNPFLNNLNLDLDIRSSGELAIKNNIAEMYLQTDLKISGPALKPKIAGALEILEGKFKYFRIEFENAKGVIDFRDPSHGPYVDVTASKEFSQRFTTATVTAQILGFADNLQLNFTSDAGLEKRDILALVFTGNLPGEGSGFSSTQVASSVLASQLSGILQGTLAEKAQLDIFRFEASNPERNNLSTLVVGKKLTQRLSLEFKTDLGLDDPVQGIQMEYLLLDNILMEASQLTDGSFDMNLTFRWKWF